MIEQRCVLGDGADASEQLFAGCHSTEKVTAGEVECLLHEKFSSAGLNPYVDRCSAVTVIGGFFVQIILHGTSKVWLAKRSCVNKFPRWRNAEYRLHLLFGLSG